MRLEISRSLRVVSVGLISLVLIFDCRSTSAASALAAWLIGSDGVLQLRTSAGSKLKAFFQASGEGKGERVWIDFPGELSRPRKIDGYGPIEEVRLGKPSKGFTRLVVELKPNIKLNPEKLKLLGISPNRWKLKLVGLPKQGLRRIGEGSVFSSELDYAKLNLTKPYEIKYFSRDLPSVVRGRYKVVLDPGHGGPDPGAIGIKGLRETDVVLDISLKVAQLLRSKGVRVSLTRKIDVDLDLPPRVTLANKVGANAFVSIHANATRTSRRDVNGIETFYFSGPRGLRLARNIQRELLRVTPKTSDRGVRRSRFFVIRRTTMPAALVETGFITGKIDGPRLSTSSYRDKISFAIAKGILNYLRGKS